MSPLALSGHRAVLGTVAGTRRCRPHAAQRARHRSGRRDRFNRHAALSDTRLVHPAAIRRGAAQIGTG